MELVYATDAEKIQRDHLSYTAWGNSLTLQHYLERELYLRAQPWSKQCMITWLLKKDGAVLSSCETFQMQSVIKISKESALQTPNATVFGIASVFTEKGHRNKGYASELLRRLLLQLKPASVVILFSDVGAPIYERIGFEPLPAWDWVFKARSDFSFEPQHWIVPPIAEYKCQSAFQFHIQPSLPQLQWHLARDTYYTDTLFHPSDPPPLIHGAQLKNSHILWANDWKKKCLQVLQLQAEWISEAQALLSFARRRAADLKLTTVRVWESESALPWDSLGMGGMREPRSGQLPMLCALVPEIQASDWNPSRATWV